MPSTDQSNTTFRHALNLLAQPPLLLALALLLLNDHLLRRLWPGWWTGKLGDAAWLLFFPVLLAAGLGWLPLREPRRHVVVGALAFSITGLGFALLKTNPQWMAGFLRLAEAWTGSSFHLIADPGDLLMLPALALGWALWTGRLRLERPLLQAANPLPRARLLLLPLAALLTIANSGIPEYGITCFRAGDGLIYAESSYRIYASADGGLTWQPDSLGQGRSCGPEVGWDGPYGEVQGADGTRYRYRPGQPIEVSQDGLAWQVGYTPEPISEAQRAYWNKTRYSSITIAPVAAYADPASGNVLFAMGHQGVLLRSAAGGWQWASLPDYAPVADFPTSDAAVLLLGGQGYLAVALALLLLSSYLLRFVRSGVRVFLVVLAWLAWLAVDVLFPPVTAFGYGTTLTILGLLVLFVLLAGLLIEQLVRLARRPAEQRGSGLPGYTGLALLGGLLYLLPYALWLYSTLPGIAWATGFGIAIAAAALAAGLLRRGDAQ